jgi:general secretion pathway protein J
MVNNAGRVALFRNRFASRGVRKVCGPLAPQCGLTLVELLVAISVLAFVAVLGWRGLDGIVRARIALTENLEQTRGMQLAFAQLQNDCANVVTRDAIPNRSPLVVDRGRLMMVRNVFSDNQPTRLQVIIYQVRDGVLTRRETTATRDLAELDTLWINASNDADNSQAVVLQQGVAAMTMRLWASNRQEWQPPDVDVLLGTQTAVGASVTGTGSAATGTTGTTGAAGATNPRAQAEEAARQRQVSITGLEVALQMQGRQDSMVKVFLLGAV